MRALVVEKEVLAQKVVSQQENVQNRIARDLHDSVLSNIMLLKRSLSENKRLADAEMIVVLDQTIEQLHEICQDLAPRDLHDWGLKIVIRDLLNRLAERTNADCSLECDSALPKLPEEVELHIFRIVQESLNNIEKYANASKIGIVIRFADGLLSYLIEDDGKGFDPLEITQRERSNASGRGSSIIRERTELISYFHPARISVNSSPGGGTRILLEIKMEGEFSSIQGKQ